MKKRDHMVRAGLLLLVVTLVWGTAPSHAQTEAAAAMDRYVHTGSYDQLLRRTFNELSPDVFPRCKGLTLTPQRYEMSEPVSWTSYNWPKVGAWKQDVFAGGCGNDAKWTVYFKVFDEHRMDKKFTFPGETHADPELQEEARNKAASGALAAVNCGSLLVRNTRFDGYEKAARPELRPWKETWTLIGCGSLIKVPLTFVPQGSGGVAVSYRAGEAQTLNPDGSIMPVQEQSVPQAAIHVSPGIRTKILSASALKKNCLKSLLPPIEILTRPKNGSASLEEEEVEAKAPQNGCGSEKLPGLSLYYIGKAGFIGSDSIVIEVFDAEGATTKTEYVLDVN